MCAVGDLVITPPFSPIETFVVPPNTAKINASVDDLPVTYTILYPNFTRYLNLDNISRLTAPSPFTVIVPSISIANNLIVFR